MDPSPKTIELLHYPGQWNLELTGSCYSTDHFCQDIFFSQLSQFKNGRNVGLNIYNRLRC